MDINQFIKRSRSITGDLKNFRLEEAPDSPFDLFTSWYQYAYDYGVEEPHSMTLSTVDEAGFPDSRILILKKIDENGFYFSSGSESTKGQHLKNNPKVALNFYWKELGKQIRVRGTAVAMDRETNIGDFLNCGQTKRALALTKMQSQPAQTLEEIDEELHEQEQFLLKNPNTINDNWLVYRVEPFEIEFFQARVDFKHVRIKYSLDEKNWAKVLLWP